MGLAVTTLVWMLAAGAAPPVRDAVRSTSMIDFHVRATDPLMRAWISNGAAESRTLRVLLEQLAASDIIIHLELVDRISGGASGQLFFVTATETVRYLRAEIVRGGSRADTIALIAHELQHAAEVAAAPRVRDPKAMAMLYLGMRENARDYGRYDSAAARMTEGIVRSEVIAHRGEPEDEPQLIEDLRHSARPER